jgi:hypothetical protein
MRMTRHLNGRTASTPKDVATVFQTILATLVGRNLVLGPDCHTKTGPVHSHKGGQDPPDKREPVEHHKDEPDDENDDVRFTGFCGRCSLASIPVQTHAAEHLCQHDGRTAKTEPKLAGATDFGPIAQAVAELSGGSRSALKGFGNFRCSADT